MSKGSKLKNAFNTKQLDNNHPLGTHLYEQFCRQLIIMKYTFHLQSKITNYFKSSTSSPIPGDVKGDEGEVRSKIKKAFNEKGKHINNPRGTHIYEESHFIGTHVPS